MAITNASTLAEYASGIGTQNATSTATYADGSKAYPCVLMAC